MQDWRGGCGRQWATTGCMRHRSSIANGIDVKFSIKCKKAYYHGLQTCKSAWACPLCSLKVAIGRKKELVVN
ncbi:MAG TPA: hypothetical protein VLL52_24940 [Anaerolineae bacterium]|nr:hypothetical protein [Anaerolineae bacterium]